MNATERRKNLQLVAELSENWNDNMTAVVSWLDSTEKRIQKLGTVPTDPDKLQQLIETQTVSQQLFYSCKSTYYTVTWYTYCLATEAMPSKLLFNQYYYPFQTESLVISI